MSPNHKATIEPFKNQLRKTYVFISIQFSVTILIGMLALVGISYLANEHLNEIGPLVTTVNRLLNGVNDSILLLDEWMLTQPKEHQEKREKTWDTVIYPIAQQLHVQLKNTKEEHNSLLKSLQHLQTEQWIIEDMTHTQGNNQALNLYLITIHDIEQKIFSVSTQIIHLVYSDTDSAQSHLVPLPLLTHSADIRGFFSISSANLLQFILTGTKECEKDFRKNLVIARNNLTKLRISREFSEEETDLINTLLKLFSQYQYQTDKAIQLRYSPKWNLAIYNYINTLEPLQKKVITELNLILENRTEKLWQSSTRLMRFGHLVILLTTLVGALTASLIILRARKDIRLAGELEESIHRHTEKLEMLSKTDQLTGLYNRRAMISLLTQELNNARLNGQPLSFVYFDVDKFKHINDNQGHIIGDQILRKVANALRASIRKTDFPCRYGGDEFCIILPGCTCTNAIKICDLLIKAFSKEVPGISLSIGITEVDPAEHIEPEQLIKITDQKMYLGKKESGFQVHS